MASHVLLPLIELLRSDHDVLLLAVAKVGTWGCSPGHLALQIEALRLQPRSRWGCR